MHRTLAILSFAVILLAGAGTSAAQSGGPQKDAPLPNATELLQRAIANERKLAAEREKYDCRISDRTIETDSKGDTKRDTAVVSDLFYVNGIPIERTLEKNGRDLSADEEHKQDERVMKETIKYSNQATAKKEEDKQNQELEDFMEATARLALMVARSVVHDPPNRIFLLRLPEQGTEPFPNGRFYFPL
ncbi:MAG: hypothetical protein WB341_18510 [Terracidiphilus sp.]